jgi:predicted transcriptional regulator
MPTDPDDQPWRYARGSDPETSRRAAESLNHKIKGEHLACMQVLLNFEVATDEMVADELVRLGIVKKSEKGRRLMRTIRENTTTPGWSRSTASR